MTGNRAVAVPALIFALVWFSAAWFGSWEFNPNNSTRLFAAISLVEQGDATIDEFAPLTIDKAKFGAHYYLDKAPGMTLMSLPAIAAADAVTGERARVMPERFDNPRFVDYVKLRLRAASILTSSLLTALAAVALYSLALSVGGSRAGAVVAALGYALGSPAWGWSTTIFGHAATAALLILALWAIWRGTSGASPHPARAALAGLLLGWAVVVEYQAVIEVALIGLWALWRMRRYPMRSGMTLALAAAAGAAVAVTPMVAYNLLAFGTPVKLGYQGVVGFEGMQQGLFGLTYPKAAVMIEILFGPRRGLLWVAPVLMFGFFGLARMARAAATRDLAVVSLAVVAAVLLVNASYAYWDGGFSTGPRHSVPAFPFLALGLVSLWQTAARIRDRVALATLLALSVAINLVIAATEITVQDWYRFPLWRPILTERLPRGAFRDLPSEFWGWTPWGGMALYLLIAAPLVFALVRLSSSPVPPQSSH